MEINVRFLVLTIAIGKPQRPLCTQRCAHKHVHKRKGACTTHVLRRVPILNTKFLRRRSYVFS